MAKFDRDTIVELKEALAAISWEKELYNKHHFDDIIVTVYSNTLQTALNLFKRSGFLTNFEWLRFKKNAELYVAKPQKIATIDLEETLQLIIYHIKQEPLQDGYLSQMIDNGHLKLVFNRFEALV